MSMLAKVTKGYQQAPERVVLYGVEGVGKSTFAAGAPAPIFLATEDGTARLDVERIPIASWAELLGAVDELIAAPHGYKTIVIDSIDHAEPMCWRALCARNKWADVETPGYGRGYVAAVDEWRQLVSMLAMARAKRGMNIVLLGHAMLRNHKNPEGADFQRYESKINDKAAGFLKEWSDHVLFARHEAFAAKSDANGDKRARGVSSGRRRIHSKWSAAYDAKTRAPLPENLELSWEAFAAALATSNEPTEDQRAELEALLEVLPDEAAKIRSWFDDVTKCKNATHFAHGLEKLRLKVDQAADAQQKAVA